MESVGIQYCYTICLLFERFTVLIEEFHAPKSEPPRPRHLVCTAVAIPTFTNGFILNGQ